MLSYAAMSYFANNPLLAFPIAALAIFMLVFFVVTLKTVLSGKDSYEAMERLPLESTKGESRE